MIDLFQDDIQYEKPQPRDYQLAAEKSFFSSTGSGLIQLATGLGKTLTFARISERMLKEKTGKHLFLAHTSELVRQTCLACIKQGIWPNIEKGRFNGEAFVPTKEEKEKLFGENFPPKNWFIFNRVIVGTYQTFIRRIEKYNKDRFDLLCIDESHRSECPSYLFIAQELRKINCELRVLGLTATPKRGDSKPLSLFPQFFYRMPITEAIDEGYLVDVVAKKIKMAGDFSRLKTRRNDEGEEDFSDEELAAILRNPEIIESIARPIIDHGENRRGIIFTCGQDISEILSDTLNSIDSGCATYVHGSVPENLRDQRIRDFRSGKYRLLVGCQMLVEGFDVQDISLVVMARLTGSSSFYEQCLGRGLRLLHGTIEPRMNRHERWRAILRSKKPDCLVLDFVNNTTRHKLVTAEQIVLGDGNPELVNYAEAVQDETKSLRSQMDELRALAELREALKDFNIHPENIDFVAEDINIFGAGVCRDKGGKIEKTNTPGVKLLEEARDFKIINPERLDSDTLRQRIAEQKNKILGKSAFITLCKLGIPVETINSLRLNWHNAQTIRRMFFANNKKLPHDWQNKFRKAN
jgi:superfamily II DNA or RNA helicase